MTKLLPKTGSSAWSLATIAIKLAVIGQLLWISNDGFVGRVAMMLERAQYPTLVIFFAIWGMAVAALLAATFHPSWAVRGFWGAVLGLGTAFGLGYFLASGSQLQILDIVSLWNARHEAGRATAQYGTAITAGALAFAFFVAANLLPGLKSLARWKPVTIALALLPVLPFALVAGVVEMKGPASSRALPNQFTPVALSALAGVKIANGAVPERETVAWTASDPLSKNIVMLVDESIRGDYIDFTPGNPFTPHMPALKSNFIDFGPAASGGNCSNYSNVLLRYLARRQDVSGSVSRNPSVFAFAKKAGFRTVFIDAQADNITDGNFLQNFMTMVEREDIDSFYGIRGVAHGQEDLELARIIAKELKYPQPTFIYANKYGAHFPYDSAYPASAAQYGPLESKVGETAEAKQASYRNAVAWSVDHFFTEFLKNGLPPETTVVYTSDHGQVLEPGKLTHCQVEDVDSRTALVPLYAMTSDAKLAHQFAQGAELSRGRASHFEIPATLLLLMGYGDRDVLSAYTSSLFHGTTEAPAFTTGDVFGLFSDVVWNPIDLLKTYLEPNLVGPPAGGLAGTDNTMQQG